MTGIYALYETPGAAQHAFDSLRSAGISVREIKVLSSEPLEDWELGAHDRKTVMPWIAGAGGAFGLLSAYLLTYVTQRAWAINTGGMPIVSNWTNIIIMFELTMLGTVLATVATLLMTARLPSRLPRLYDPAISDGKILVGVVNPQQSLLVGIEQALNSAHPEVIRKLEA
jgi:hypothetical protein